MNILFLDCDGVINSENFLNEWIMEHGNTPNAMNQFNEKYFFNDGHTGYIVPELVDRLKKICKETDCKIVWSSSWRENYLKDPRSESNEFDLDKIEQLWKAKGLPFENFIGCTDVIAFRRFSYVPRTTEIEKWINDNASNLDRIAILDDDPDAWHNFNMSNVFFFQTNFDTGLTETLTDSIIEYFKS